MESTDESQVYGGCHGGRIKGSTGYPDDYKNERFFTSERYLGAAWKNMPADLSEEKMGNRIFGLKSHPEENIKSFKKDIEAAMGDSYPPIAVLASAIAYEHFNNVEAEEKLKQFCKSDNMHLALLSLNSILYFDNKRPFLEIVKQI